MKNLTSTLPLNIPRVLSGSLIVAGTAIGAGMLGIPFVTAKAGFLGAWLITIAVWLFMLFTGLMYIEITLQMPRGSNILSMTRRFLGHRASLFAGFMFFFLYYCFMVAYFSGGSPLFQKIMFDWFHIQLSSTVSCISFSALISLAIYFGARVVDRSNMILMFTMIFFYALLLGNSFQGSVYPLDLSMHISPMLIAIPILFGAFGYHNVIPSLCDYLEQDRKSLHFSVILGTALALIVYLLWQGLILTNVSPELIEKTFREGKTPVFALQQSSNNQALSTFATYFSICALATSILGVGLSLVDFLRDGFQMKGIRAPRLVLILIAFLPPLFFCLTNQSIFYTALAWAGGFGESFLNGVLPILLVWKARYAMMQTPDYQAYGEKPFLSGMLFCAVGVGVIEVLDSLGYR